MQCLELKKIEGKKELGMKCLQSLEKDLDQEYDAAAKLISEASKQLSVALSKLGKVTIATALIDSANKKMAAVQEKKETLSLKWKQVHKRKDAIVKNLKKSSSSKDMT